MGVRSLPKLDWGSPELRRRMTDVTRRWLEPPYDLDGWRIDVANMVGRYRDLAVTASVASEIRRTVGDKLLLAEHGHDFRADLAGRRLAGEHELLRLPAPGLDVAARRGACRRSCSASSGASRSGCRASAARTSSPACAASAAGIPWDRVLHSWTLLDSHDTARFRTVAGSREAQLVGVGLQMTTPGVPMVFAGDEIGLEGDWGEDARRTMPWGRPETWDTRHARRVPRARGAAALEPARSRAAGMRYAHVSADAIAYLRELPGERLLCLAARAGHDPIHLPLARLGCASLETLVGGDAEVRGGDAVLPHDGPAFHVWRLT